MGIQNVAGMAVLALVVAAFASESVAADDAQGIIEEFCEETTRLANEAEDELNDARRDLRQCRRRFNNCREGDFIGDDDPLVQCLSRGLSCTSRAIEDRAEACEDFSREIRDSYDDALAHARRNDVEDEVQEFFNSPSEDRAACFSQTARVALRCAAPSRLRQ